MNAHVASENEPVRVGSTLKNRGEQQIIATNPLSKSEVLRIRRVIFTFRSKDQGWSSFPNQRGTYEGSWTWFEAGLTRPVSSDPSDALYAEQLQIKVAKERVRYELQRNRHAGSEPEVYRIEFDVGHELLRSIKAGDSIVLWARALYPGWENRVYDASIEVWCVDDLEAA